MVGQKLILLVEDNPDDEELTLRAIKQSQVLNQVIVVHDGEEALEYLFNAGGNSGQVMRTLPQVILLDLKLPKVSGFDVLKRVRNEPRTQFLPVVVMTSSSEEEDIYTSYKLGPIAMCASQLHLITSRNLYSS